MDTQELNNRQQQKGRQKRQAKNAGTIRNRIRVVQAWDEC